MKVAGAFKAGFLVAVLVLLSLKLMNAQQAIVTLPDAVMLAFFVAAFCGAGGTTPGFPLAAAPGSSYG